MKIFHIMSSIILAIVIFIVGFYFGATQNENTSRNTVSSDLVNIVIDSGDDTLRVFQDKAISETDTIFDALLRLQKQGDIELVYEDYGGDLGVFLQGIDGVGVGENISGSKWWHFWVNGTYAQVGVSSQILHPGDVILFKYMPAQERVDND
jgi:hypothetical protein